MRVGTFPREQQSPSDDTRVSSASLSWTGRPRECHDGVFGRSRRPALPTRSDPATAPRWRQARPRGRSADGAGHTPGRTDSRLPRRSHPASTPPSGTAGDSCGRLAGGRARGLFGALWPERQMLPGSQFGWGEGGGVSAPVYGGEVARRTGSRPLQRFFSRLRVLGRASIRRPRRTNHMTRTVCIAGLAAFSVIWAGSPHAATLRCAADSVKVGNVCVDKYEASVWSIAPSNTGLIRKVQKGMATLDDLMGSGAVQLGRTGAPFSLTAYPANFPADGNWTPVLGSDPPSPGVYAVSIRSRRRAPSRSARSPRRVAQATSDAPACRFTADVSGESGLPKTVSSIRIPRPLRCRFSPICSPSPDPRQSLGA